MDIGPLTKIKAARAAEVCAALQLTPEARALLGQDEPPAAFLGRLLDRALFNDAVAFLAHALPKREATWWACLAARTALPPEPAPALTAALEAAEAWVYKPNDAARRDAQAKGEAAGLSTAPAALAAAAAGWSGGSLTPADAPAVPPDDKLTPTAVYTAVLMAATAPADPQAIQARYRLFLEQALDIAKGGTGRVQPAPQS
jgi:hypothetical protein